MEMTEAGAVDSEGAFTLSHQRSAVKLREQFAGDPILGYTELLQGFRQAGASKVWLKADSFFRKLSISAAFPDSLPDLSRVFGQPLAVLEAQDYLHSGTGLLLLQHGEDSVSWSMLENEREQKVWLFNNRDGLFELQPKAVRLDFGPHAKGALAVMSLQIKSAKPLAIYGGRDHCWRDTVWHKDFVSRMAFFGTPLYSGNQLLQTPIPGRLVPKDHWRKLPRGQMGYNWEPLAFQLYAGSAQDSMSFLSEPFTGVVGDVVNVNGQVQTGFGVGSKPDYVDFVASNRESRCRVPFQVRRFFGRSYLTLPGFSQFPGELINPRMEGGLTRIHCWGKPVYCSRLIMLSSALQGPSTIVFTRHGCVLGGRHEDLGVGGTLCVVTSESLSTDLSRRSIRDDQAYQDLVDELRSQVRSFAAETIENLPEDHLSIGEIQANLRV